MSDRLYLQSADAGAFRPAITLGQGLPKEHLGQPITYAWKDSIRAGEYVVPATGQKLSVDAKRIDGWVKTYRKMIANGMKVPAPVNHSGKTEDNRGWVIDARRNGESLELLYQLIGEDAARDAARSEISLQIRNRIKDGKGNVYEDAIEHASLVPDPVIPGQSGFESVIAASRGQPLDGPVFILAASNRSPDMDLLAKLRVAFGAADLTEDQIVAKAKELAGLPAQLTAKTDELTLSLSAHTADKALLTTAEQAKLAAETALAEAETKLTDKDAELVALSRSAEAPDPEALDALAEADEAGLDALVSLGRINPATCEKLKVVLVKADGKPNAFTLSRSLSGSPVRLSRAVIDALKENKPVDLGTQSGVQTLSRQAPGATVEDDAEAQKKFIEERAARAAGKAA